MTSGSNLNGKVFCSEKNLGGDFEVASMLSDLIEWHFKRLGPNPGICLASFFARVVILSLVSQDV